jgi:hypothetical protein
MTRSLASLIILTATSTAFAKKVVVPPAGPTVAKIASVKTNGCSTDGGNASCSSGVHYLGDLVKQWWNEQLEQTAIACADAKPGTYSFRFGYGYNDGKTFLLDSEKAQAKLPACVKDFADKLGGKYMEWWHILQPIDGSIDVNTDYKVTIQIKK